MKLKTGTCFSFVFADLKTTGKVFACCWWRKLCGWSFFS